MRKILYDYFSFTSTDNNFNSINLNVNSIFDSYIDDELDKTMKKLLYKELPKRLVKASVKLYEENPGQYVDPNESVRDILIEFLDNLDIFGDLLPENIKNIFKTNVASYFESFTSRTILLWLVNIENIFKFFINNYRSTDILLQLIF
jgi:hypothetical protein